MQSLAVSLKLVSVNHVVLPFNTLGICLPLELVILRYTIAKMYMLLLLITGGGLLLPVQAQTRNNTKQQCFDFDDCESCLNGQDSLKSPCE